MHREAMAEEYRHPDRGRVDRQPWQLEHPPTLLPQPSLLARHPIRLQSINLGYDVEGDLAAERPPPRLLSAQHGHGLAGEFIHGSTPAARHRLIRRHLGALDPRQSM